MDDDRSELQSLDLRRFCRKSSEFLTTVSIVMDPGERGEPWLRLGQCDLFERDSHHFKGQWRLTSYLGNAQDVDHHSVRFLSLPLIGVELGSVHYSRTTVRAWIAAREPDPERYPDFQVPKADYDPFKGAVRCSLPECEDEGTEEDGLPHWIGDMCWHQPFNAALFEQVRGRKVEISFMPAPKEET